MRAVRSYQHLHGVKVRKRKDHGNQSVTEMACRRHLIAMVPVPLWYSDDDVTPFKAYLLVLIGLEAPLSI